MGAECLVHSAVFTSICSYGNQQELVIPTSLIIIPVFILYFAYYIPLSVHCNFNSETRKTALAIQRVLFVWLFEKWYKFLV